ncbi:MAG TPA: hypothetical protein VIK12_06840, partial [Pengzhenrongella sp.]
LTGAVPQDLAERAVSTNADNLRRVPGLEGLSVEPDPDLETSAATQHAVEPGGTLCGLPAEDIVVVRNPFWGDRPNDCEGCAARLRTLAEEGANDARM